MYSKECDVYIKNHKQHSLSRKHEKLSNKMISFKNTSVNIKEFKNQ